MCARRSVRRSFDLVGVSYGTRMAQQYAMRYPEAVRSLVLDSVVPNELVLGEDFARNLDDALKAQFAHCTGTRPASKQFRRSVPDAVSAARCPARQPAQGQLPRPADLPERVSGC